MNIKVGKDIPNYRQVNSQCTLLYEDIVPLEFESILK